MRPTPKRSSEQGLPHRWRQGVRIAVLAVLAWAVIASAPMTTGSAVGSPDRMLLSRSLSCVNVVENGDFELGVGSLAPWVSKGFAVVSDQRVHSGSFAFWMGGYRNADDSLFQAVVIPEAESVTFSYWWNMHSLEDVSAAHDRLVVSLRSDTGEVIDVIDTRDNTGDRDAWAQAAFDLSPFRGMSVVLHISCQGDAENVTSFFIDDVELQVCGEVATATPTATAAASATPTSTPTATSTASHQTFLPLLWKEPTT